MNFASFIFISIFFGIALSKPFQDSHSASEATESSQKPPYCTGKFDFDCGEDELRVRCISSLWICDHVYDCTTGIDENCVYLHNCPSGFFMCLNGDCISAKKRCDGIKDCLDDSDERACFPMEKGIPINDLNSADSQYLAGHDHVQHPVNNHQAEAIVGENDGVSAVTVIFLCTLIIGLALLATYWALHRYPNAASRVDEALKEFRPRNALPNRLLQRNSQSRVNIISQGNANNDQFFDNPMNTIQQQQPLILNVAAPVGSSSSHVQSPQSNAQ